MGHLILKGNEETALKSLKEALCKKFDIVDLRVFGSKARGESSDESDIDVMIEVADTNPEIEAQIDDMIFEINLENDSFISAVIFSKKELEEGPLAESPIYKIVQREGIQI